MSKNSNIGQVPLIITYYRESSLVISRKNLTRVSNNSIHNMAKIIEIHFLVERILLQEDDLIAQVRMDALMQLFEISNDEKVTKMILNVLETYRKLLIRETDIQNKISSLTMQKLLKYNMIILCQRKQYEHLYSMVSEIN